jgi:hypothetical protein
VTKFGIDYEYSQAHEQAENTYLCYSVLAFLHQNDSYITRLYFLAHFTEITTNLRKFYCIWKLNKIHDL